MATRLDNEIMERVLLLKSRSSSCSSSSSACNSPKNMNSKRLSDSNITQSLLNDPLDIDSNYIMISKQRLIDLEHIEKNCSTMIISALSTFYISSLINESR